MFALTCTLRCHRCYRRRCRPPRVLDNNHYLFTPTKRRFLILPHRRATKRAGPGGKKIMLIWCVPVCVGCSVETRVRRRIAPRPFLSSWPTHTTSTHGGVACPCSRQRTRSSGRAVARTCLHYRPLATLVLLEAQRGSLGCCCSPCPTNRVLVPVPLRSACSTALIPGNAVPGNWF